jgi:hypothetical protein
MIPLTPKETKEAIIKIIKGNKVPFLQSSPGLGKSDIARQISSEYNLKMIDIRLSQRDSVDLNGFPMLDKDTKRMGYAPLDEIPLEGIDEVPAGYNGFFMLLDEINSASLSTQAASYKLILDRSVGNHMVHRKCFIMAAGNLITDKAIVNSLGTAMQSRLIHIIMHASEKDWQEWAAKNEIDTRIRSFLHEHPRMLHQFDPDHHDYTFPSPRTWEFLSDIIKPIKEFNAIDIAIMQGTVGEGAAIEFKTFTELHHKLPTREEMISNPDGVEIPDEPSMLYALSLLIGSFADPKNCDKLIKVINRLPPEFQVITIKDIYSRDGETKNHKAIVKWKQENASKFFDN